MPLNQLQSAGILDGVRALSLDKVRDARFRAGRSLQAQVGGSG
jgi:hypothetical protein